MARPPFSGLEKKEIKKKEKEKKTGGKNVVFSPARRIQMRAWFQGADWLGTGPERPRLPARKRWKNEKQPVPPSYSRLRPIIDANSNE